MMSEASLVLGILLGQNTLVYLLLHAASMEPESHVWSKISCVMLQELGKFVVSGTVLLYRTNWSVR